LMFFSLASSLPVQCCTKMQQDEEDPALDPALDCAARDAVACRAIPLIDSERRRCDNLSSSGLLSRAARP
jgi:hypothetical protein